MTVPSHEVERLVAQIGEDARKGRITGRVSPESQCFDRYGSSAADVAQALDVLYRRRAIGHVGAQFVLHPAEGRDRTGIVVTFHTGMVDHVNTADGEPRAVGGAVLRAVVRRLRSDVKQTLRLVYAVDERVAAFIARDTGATITTKRRSRSLNGAVLISLLGDEDASENVELTSRVIRRSAAVMLAVTDHPAQWVRDAGLVVVAWSGRYVVHANRLDLFARERR